MTTLALREPPSGMPASMPEPPVVAESADPFTALRIIELASRLPRGHRIPISVVVDRLNASHLDWLFPERVVVDGLVQLAANWAADYRTTDGIRIEDGPSGATIEIEESTRVDPWIVRQAVRAEAMCLEALLEFSRRDRTTGAD